MDFKNKTVLPKNPLTFLKDGQPVESDAGFANLLRVDNQTGAVFLAEKLDRNSVAVITLNVQVCPCYFSTLELNLLIYKQLSFHFTGV